MLGKIFLFVLIIYICLSILIYSLINQKSELFSEKERKDTIFCFILTQSKNFDSRTKVIHSTWATQCDNYKFISSIPDHLKDENYFAKNEIVYKNMSILEPPGMLNDTYKKLTDKVYLTLKYLHKKYGYYDWYLKSDDDTFIFTDNLRKFIKDKNKKLPVTYGFDFKVIVPHGYHSGGGGYLISNEAMWRIGSKLNENYTFCPNTGTEDVDMGRCFRQLGVYPNKSIDELGRERFHPLSLNAHYHNHTPDWMHSYASNPVKPGLECCSDTSISFHYMSIKSIEKLHRITKFNSKNLTFREVVTKLEDENF